MMNIGTDEAPKWVFLAESGGFIDAIVRAADEETFLAAALAAGLRHNNGDGYVWADGVHVSVIGSVVLTHAEYDGDGNLLSEAVIDNRYHANLRISPPAVERLEEDGTPRWHTWALAWSAYGTEDTQINNNESGLIYLGVSLIDPDTISKPVRVWL